MRVKAVVGSTIMVALADVVPGDVLGYTSGEHAPRIIEVEKNNEGHYRFRYDIRGIQPTVIAGRSYPPVEFSNWMDPNNSNGVFIHDLHRERFEFLEAAS